MIHYIESNQFVDEILKDNKLLLVNFYIEDSIPCKMQSDILREIEKEYRDDIEIFKIDLNESNEFAFRYNVTSCPTTLLFLNGNELERKVGLTQKDELCGLIREIVPKRDA